MKKKNSCQISVSALYPEVTRKKVDVENREWAKVSKVIPEAVLWLRTRNDGVKAVRKLPGINFPACQFHGEVILAEKWFFDDLRTCVSWTNQGLTIWSKSSDERRIKAIIACGVVMRTDLVAHEHVAGSMIIPVAVYSTTQMTEAIL